MRKLALVGLAGFLYGCPVKEVEQVTDKVITDVADSEDSIELEFDRYFVGRLPLDEWTKYEPSMQIADMNRDGALDIVLMNDRGLVYVLENTWDKEGEGPTLKVKVPAELDMTLYNSDAVE